MVSTMFIVLFRPPLQVESALMSSNYVDNVMLHADPFHSYCVALIVPVHQALERWAQEAGIEFKSFSELCEKAEAVREVQQSLSKVCLLLIISKIASKF